jgi:hypothetical protein
MTQGPVRAPSSRFDRGGLLRTPARMQAIGLEKAVEQLDCD